MKNFLPLLSLFFIGLHFTGSCKGSGNQYRETGKPVLIITTDIGGDPDDTQSLTRILLYANEFDLRGIIVSASGTRGELGVDTIQPGLVHRHIDAYEEVLPSLRRHDPGFPSADYLHSIVKRGNPHRGLSSIGEGHDTEASEWIIRQVDDATGKVNIAIWGGQTDVVQALWKVKQSRDPEEFSAFISKLRIHDINDQDGIYEYIRDGFPGLFYILNKAPEGIDKREGAYRGMYLGGDESLTSREWIDTNIRSGHGALCALYPPKTWTAPNPHGVLKEGDTPSWFYFLKNGLQDADHPEWGGWGGRYIQHTNRYYRDAEDFAGGDIHARATVYRWRPAFQAAFAARADWCVSAPEGANHAPEVVVNGDDTNEVITLEVPEGGSVTVNTIGTGDPDGDSLSYYWWIYPEAGTAHQCPEMWPIDQPDVGLEIPEGEAGREMHLILEVTDTGKPALTSYRRIVLEIQ